ncbi:DUF4302 domain-containing protein [Sphingobacterium sp. LRF_L2]|uniref:DUF4302 domain-containing protein n=1 Tax=Sphingobacterium sp. LRF_L2 TaxID=3369421 RepID=UPI003F5DA7D7
MKRYTFNSTIVRRALSMAMLLSSVLIMASCSKDSLEAIPVETSFEKPDVALANFVNELGTATDGWEFGLATSNVGYFAGYLDFSETSLQFTVDAFAATHSGLQSNNYRTFVSNTNPSLSFTTGIFNDFAQQQGNIDTAYTFQAIRQDSIFLLGNRFGNQLTLVKSSLAKATAYKEDGIAKLIHSVSDLAKLPRYFKRMVVNGAEYDLHFRPELKTLFIHYGGTERFKVHETAYAPTATGVALQKPLVDGVNVISYLDDFLVDVEKGELALSTNGIPRVFTNEYAPSAYDVNAAVRFYNNPPYQININYPDETVAERYSASTTGFTVAGVEDAYGLQTIAGFNFFMFIHKLSRQEYGAAWFVIGNTLSNYGPAVLRQYSNAGGIIRFVRLGEFASPPAEIATIINTTSSTFTDELGFFVVHTGGVNYDLVSINVTAGQKWIRFE